MPGENPWLFEVATWGPDEDEDGSVTVTITADDDTNNPGYQIIGGKKSATVDMHNACIRSHARKFSGLQG